MKDLEALARKLRAGSLTEAVRILEEHTQNTRQDAAAELDTYKGFWEDSCKA